MDNQEKTTFKVFVDMIKRHPIAVIMEIVALVFGAFMGLLAYSNNWL